MSDEGRIRARGSKNVQRPVMVSSSASILLDSVAIQGTSRAHNKHTVVRLHSRPYPPNDGEVSEHDSSQL